MRSRWPVATLVFILPVMLGVYLLDGFEMQIVVLVAAGRSDESRLELTRGNTLDGSWLSFVDDRGRIESSSWLLLNTLSSLYVVVELLGFAYWGAWIESFVVVGSIKLHYYTILSSHGGSGWWSYFSPARPKSRTDGNISGLNFRSV